MKYHTQTLVIVIFLCFTYSSQAQSVGISNTAAPIDETAILDISSSEKGVLIPRMTSTQRNAIIAPAEGLLVYDTDTHSFCFYQGDKWQSLGTSAQIPQIAFGSTQPQDISGNQYGSIADFEVAFDSIPVVISSMDESINNNGGSWVRLERESAPNRIAFRTNNTLDNLYYFSFDYGVHEISDKTIMTGIEQNISSTDTIFFPESFDAPPIIFLQNEVLSGSGATRTRVWDVTADWAVIWKDNNVGNIHWIAMDAGEYEHNGCKWYADQYDGTIQSTTTINYPPSFNSTPYQPIAFGTIYDTNNSGPNWIRVTDLTAQSVEFQMGASTEIIHWLAIMKVGK